MIDSPTTSERPRRSRALVPLICAGTALTLLEAAALWLAQAGDPWNNARLAPAIALHRGFRLYYALSSGPVLSTVVGPVSFLAYWPVGFIHGSPTLLILSGCAMNLLCLGALGIWLFQKSAARGTALAVSWLIGAQLVLFYPSLRYSIFCIHADAPALFFSGCGLGLLVAVEGLPSWRRCIAAAFCLALAVWAKQSLVLIFPAVALLVARQWGFRSLARFAVCAVAAGILVSGVLAAWLGGAVLWDNMVRVPAHHPWWQFSASTGEVYYNLHAVGRLARLKVLGAESLHIIRESWALFALLAAALAGSFARRANGVSRQPHTPWSAFFLITICLFPVAAFGRVKVGGAVNQESFVVFFLVVAFVAWFADDDGYLKVKARARLGVLGVLLVINAPQVLDLQGWRAVGNNQNENAYRYDVAHPGAVYFPWNPLTSLLAEDRLYHFDYGVYDRNLGGAWVTAQHIRQNLPSPRPVIASTIAHHDYILRTYFPDYVERPPQPNLPGWRIYGPPASR